MNKTLSILSLLLVASYRTFLSPFFGGSCRFEPSCSQYAQEAFSSYSFGKALKLSMRRLSKCRPWGQFGIDPVPRKIGSMDGMNG